jgi:hypothetical protein
MAAVPADRPLRSSALTLSGSYLLAIVLLGPLLGSTADASTAFRDHFADDGNRLRDVAGSLALLVAAASLVWTALTARASSRSPVVANLGDLTAAAAGVTAAVLVVASGLLLTVPATTSIGEITDDPGIDEEVQAGIAQAGSVMVFVAALCLAFTAVLLARLGRRSGAVDRWVVACAWLNVVCAVLGVSVVLLVPFGAWAAAVALVWREVGDRAPD